MLRSNRQSTVSLSTGRMSGGAMLAAGMLAVAMASTAGSAQSLPAAVDLVPTSAPLVVSIPSINTFKSKLEGMLKLMPAGATEQIMGPLSSIMAMDGLNTNGSVAVAILNLGDEQGGEPQVVVVAPVRNYEAFAKGVGADPKGVGQAEIDGNPVSMKDIGNGFAVLGETPEVVEGFKPASGSARAFASLIGTSGMSVATTSDLFVIGNIDPVRPMLQAGADSLAEQMMENMPPGMNGMGAMAEQMEAVAKSIADDGRAYVVGLGANEAGLSLRGMANFKEGSRSAGYLTPGSNAGELIGRLPAKPYIIAFATDSRSPGIRKLMDAAHEMSQSMNAMMAEEAKNDEMLAAQLGPMLALQKSMQPMTDAMRKADGSAMLMGTNPVITAGAFVNTLVYVQTKDPAGLREAMASGISAMNNFAQGGVSLLTQVERGAQDLTGVKADRWKMQIKTEPANPELAQVGMMTMGLFGPGGGPAGFIAPAKQGLVMSMGRNTPLMQEALSAANNGGAFGSDALTKAVAGMLPSGRFVEGYLGLRDVWDMATQAAAMMGGLPFEYDMPANTPPIGFGLGAGDNALAFGAFVPNQLFEMIAEIQKQMGGGMDPEGGMEEGDDGRF